MPLQSNQISVHEILEMIFQNKWLFLFCTALGILVAYVIVDNTDKWYASQAEILVVDRNSNEPLLKGLGVTTSVNHRFNAVRTKLLSIRELEETARYLQNSPKYRDQLGNLASQPPDIAAKNLKASVNMGVSRGVIYIRAERQSHTEAWAIVDYMHSLVQREFTAFSEKRLDEALQVLDGLLKVYEARLEQAEELLRDFKVYNQMDLVTTPEQLVQQADEVQMTQGGPNALVSQLMRLFEKHSDNEIQLGAMEAKYESIRQQLQSEPEYRTRSMETERSQVAEQLEVLLHQKTTELEGIMQDKTAIHPLVQQKMQEVEAVKQRLEENWEPVVTREEQVLNPVYGDLKLQASNLQSEIQARQKEQDRLIQQISNLQERISAIPEKELQKSRKRREVGIQENLYGDIRRRYEQAILTSQLEEGDQSTSLEVLNEATRDNDPIRPNQKFMYLMGWFLGMVVGFLLCFVREFTDTSFRNLDDASRFLDLPVLGVIPQVENISKRGKRKSRGRRSHRTKTPMRTEA